MNCNCNKIHNKIKKDKKLSKIMHMNVGQFVYEHAYIFSAILLLPLQGEQFSPYSSMAHENF